MSAFEVSSSRVLRPSGSWTLRLSSSRAFTPQLLSLSAPQPLDLSTPQLLTPSATIESARGEDGVGLCLQTQAKVSQA